MILPFYPPGYDLPVDGTLSLYRSIVFDLDELITSDATVFCQKVFVGEPRTGGGNKINKISHRSLSHSLEDGHSEALFFLSQPWLAQPQIVPRH